MEEPYKERDPFLSFLLPFVFYFLLSLLSEMEMEKENGGKREEERKKSLIG